IHSARYTLYPYTTLFRSEQIIKVTKGMIGAPLVFGKPHLAILLLFFLILGILYDVYRRKKLALFLLAVVALLFFQTKHPLENEVTVVDVGQGDSLFLRDVTGKTRSEERRVGNECR